MKKKETMLIIMIIVMGVLSIGATYFFFNIYEYGTLFKPPTVEEVQKK